MGSSGMGSSGMGVSDGLWSYVLRLAMEQVDSSQCLSDPPVNARMCSNSDCGMAYSASNSATRLPSVVPEPLPERLQRPVSLLLPCYDIECHILEASRLGFLIYGFGCKLALGMQQ